jgi:N-acetylmuramoyl-L-alanine amidase
MAKRWSGAIVALLVLLAAACKDGGQGAAPLPSMTVAETATAASPLPTATPRVTHIVAISAGHGGPENVGAVHRNAEGEVDLVEKDLNLDVARRLDELLRAAGYGTVLIRGGDYTLATTVPGDFAATVRGESQERADIANAAGADIILAIHFNGGEPEQAGTAVFYDPDRAFGDESRMLATSIYDALIDTFLRLGYDAPQNGVLNDSMTAAAELTGTGHTFLLGESPGFRTTQMPGMIGEALFVTNDAEAALLRRDDVRQAIAQGYKDGIDAYFAWLSAQP